MPRNVKVELQSKSSYGLRAQQRLGQYDFPFTLNPVVGCSFACKYCFSPMVYYSKSKDRRERFFEHITVKTDKSQRLNEDLTRFSVLPQHMKRVQINETSEYYQPQVLRKLKEQNQPDVMHEILEVFQEHWNQGNKWMLHILTKSHLILRELEMLQKMKEMVQVEVSFATGDEATRRRLEFYSTSIAVRLKTVELLAKAGIFVRIMAMPFYGGTCELEALKDETFRRGAKAFKNKGLNYYADWDSLLEDCSYDEYLKKRVPMVRGRSDEKEESLIYMSGEVYKPKGRSRSRRVTMPHLDEDGRATTRWEAVTMMRSRFRLKNMTVIDCGYRLCNNEDWGYIV